MNKKITILFCVVLFNLSMSQSIEDFEGEPLGGSAFVLEGVSFSTDGDFLISEFDNFSCESNSGTNRYLDTGYLDGSSSGIFGSISRTDNQAFQVSTTIAQCVWPGINDGENETSGTLRIIGVRIDNSTISEDFAIESTNFTDLVSIIFSNTIWNGEDLKRLDFEILSGMDYFALDNLAFLFPSLSINESNSRKNQITPNPVINEITIQASVNIGAKYELYSITGRRIKSGNISNQKLNVEDIDSGFYLLVIDNKDIFKFIKK